MKNLLEKAGWAAVGFTGANVLLFGVMFRRPKVHWDQEKYDCAVVCGCRVENDGQPSEVLKTRVEKAAELWKEGRIRYLIMSGAGVYNDYVEAEAMKRYAMELGVPQENILEERRAVSTYHNLLYSGRIVSW